MTKKEQLLRPRDVAWILDCSPDDVVVLAKKGNLIGMKQGRYWKFRERDVIQYKRWTERGAD